MPANILAYRQHGAVEAEQCGTVKTAGAGENLLGRP
jgi:hypothetical protein